jgi:hypothetical protein
MPMIWASISSIGCVSRARRSLQPFQPRLLNRFDLLANEVQSGHIAAQLGYRVRRKWLVFRAAQCLETIVSLARLDVEVANAKSDQSRLYPVHNAGLLFHQRI